MCQAKFTCPCQVCMCYSSSHFRRWSNHMFRVYPLSKILYSINSYQRQYSVLRSCIRYIKQQHIRFWDTHWNISKETTAPSDIHNNNIEMLQAAGFDSSLQRSLDEFSEETFDDLEGGANWEIVTEILAFNDLQSFTKCLRQTLVFLWNRTQREKFNFYFPGVFGYYWNKFYFGKKTGH